MEKLISWWERLTAPHVALPPPERRQARFLSSLLLFFLSATVLFHAAGYALTPVAEQPGIVISLALSALTLTPLYLFSRTVHYQLVALVAGYTLSALIIIAALFVGNQPSLLTILVIPLLIVSVLLSLRATAVLAVTNIILLALCALFTADLLPLLRVAALYTVTAGAILLSAYQQRSVHADQEAELLRSESRFRTLSERALIGIYIIQDGLFRYVNPAMAELFAYTPDEIIDTLGPLDLTAPEQRDVVDLRVQERLRGEKDIAQYELHGIRKDGKRIYCEILGRTMDYNGRPALIGILSDITGRRQMQESDREQRALLEALRDTATVLNSTLDRDQILSRILENVGRVVPHDGANIMLRDGHIVRVVRFQGYYDTLGDVNQIMATTHDFHETANLRYMVETGRPCVIKDTALDPNWNRPPGSEWIRSYIGAPISLGGEVIGFVNLDSLQPGFFNETHAERLMAFADQVAIAMKNARLYQNLEHYSESLEQAVAARTLELRRTTEQLEVILNNSPDAVILLRNDGLVRMANPAFYEMFGYEESEVLQQPLPALVSPAAEKDFFAALDSVLQRGKRARLELPARRKDGTTFDADVALAPVVDDGLVRGGVCSLHDISRLKEVDRMKDAFVSNVSHELRTPITSLRLYHDLLLRNPAKREVYLQRQEREIDRLNTIIEDLLRLSRLDRGQLDVSLEDLSLNDLVAAYVQDRQPLAAELGLQLHWEPSPHPLMVPADRGLLEQVIGIMLTNAFNYTAPHSTVTISTAALSHEGSLWATCSVCDRGPGIAAAEFDLLFDRFYRGAAAQQSRHPGTGLGLAIAREIVERHDGFIEVRNKDDEPGAIFTLWLPLSTEVEPQTS